ncbi:MAG TPA: precorrin-3B C(17)-methyltransferase [Oscillospiraceae bacterium]|nr:precorrin-3B C(17)-methyltransferase [Oscillospiraceae bacterium]
MAGKLTVVGLGGGGGEDMTLRAAEALRSCEVIAGYSGYISLIRNDYPEKEVLSTGMCGEEERCRAALEKAAEGKNVAMVCSGDPGVYGMAGLCLELNAALSEPVEIEVVPGVTAACSGAALLGAPLGHDFAVISLSDLLTPWEVIEKRLRAAAEGDFILCLYNPASFHRADYLARACDILLEQKSPETICGMARQIGREEESMRILPLGELRNTPADMFTTVFIGSSQTREIGGRMVTPRRYPLHE